MASTKAFARRHIIERAMEKILHMKNEIKKKEMAGDYAAFIRSDETGLTSITVSEGRRPTFSSYVVDCQDGTYMSIDLEALHDKEPELFEMLLIKYPTEKKIKGDGSVSLSFTEKAYNLAADELDISKVELEEIKAKAKEYKVK